MKSFIAKLKTWLTRLAFWRKSAAPLDESKNDTGAPQPSRFARLMQALPWRRKAKLPPLDPEQTVVVERPTRKQLEAAESEQEAPPKLSWFARLKEKFRRQPKLEALEESDATDDLPASAKRRASADEETVEAAPPKLSWFARFKGKFRRQPKLEALEESDETDNLPGSTKRSTTKEEETEAEEPPKPGLFKRLLAVFTKKWVWIPSLGVLVLALIGGVVFMLLQASHEKQSLQAELKKAQKKIEQQAAVVKQVTAAKEAAPIEISPEPVKPAPTMIGAANPDSKPGVNAGDCVVTSKESVAASLKGCIDSFNAGAGANKKKP